MCVIKTKRVGMIILLLLFVVVATTLVPQATFADNHCKTEFCLLSPGVVKDYTPEQGLGIYLQGLFNLGIGIASALAVIMIVIGGIQYMLTGSIAKKGQAKETINAAILGLVLALVAFTVLKTINKDLVAFDLVKTIEDLRDRARLESVGVEPSDISPEEQTVRDRLKQAGIIINNPPCAAGQTTGCTNVGGLPENAIVGIIELKDKCKCAITITGGSEGGHTTHGPGNPVVDIRPNQALNNFLTGSPNKPPHGTEKSTQNPKAIYRFEEDGRDGAVGDHWHVIFG